MLASDVAALRVAPLLPFACRDRPPEGLDSFVQACAGDGEEWRLAMADRVYELFVGERQTALQY